MEIRSVYFKYVSRVPPPTVPNNSTHTNNTTTGRHGEGHDPRRPPPRRQAGGEPPVRTTHTQTDHRRETQPPAKIRPQAPKNPTEPDPGTTKSNASSLVFLRRFLYACWCSHANNTNRRDIFYRMGFVDREIVALSGGKKTTSKQNLPCIHPRVGFGLGR